MGNHHLVLGRMQDILSGKTIEDTHDNRYRQKLAALLLDAGYRREEIRSHIPLVLKCSDKRARIHLDFFVSPEDKSALLLRYGPGSLVTRRTPGRAAALLMHAPLVVISNGEDAELMETATGHILATGLAAIPRRHSLPPADTPSHLPPALQDRCHRILYAFEVNDACPCDEGVCHLDPEEKE